MYGTGDPILICWPNQPKAHPLRQLRPAEREEEDLSVPSKIRSPPCLISEMKVRPTSRACPPLPSASEDAHCPGTNTIASDRATPRKKLDDLS